MGKYEAKVDSVKTLAATVISPKVKAGAVWAVVAILGLAALNGITPDMLTFLGPWQTTVQNVVVAASSLIGAWLKRDGLRELGGLVAEEQIKEAKALEQ